MKRLASRQHGVSLIEALVAMAIMAFGMLGIVGVQSTLRSNNDIAKQRSEAVRLAQQAIEDQRSFVQVVTPSNAGIANYNDIITKAQAIDAGAGYTPLGNVNLGVGAPTLAAYVSSAAYTLTTNVVDSGLADNSVAPRMKMLQVVVSWLDRANNAQTATLSTTITRVTPDIAGTLGISADVGTDGVPTKGPFGRNASIPTPAVSFGDGTSGYIPPNRPNGDNTAWLIKDTTGLVTICTTNLADNSLLNAANQLSCAGGAKAWLISGTVDFATNAAIATATDAIHPKGLPQAVQVGFQQTFPAPAAVCYTTAPELNVAVPPPYVSYVCAVVVSPASNPSMAWSGYSYVTGGNLTEAAGGHRVCRYTSLAANDTVQSGHITNALHPNAYWHAGSGLAGQNFLVVPYVTGADTDCPSGPPLPTNWTTFPQPSNSPPPAANPP
ncbi:MAG: prepilin-type N-terminal cleavage/methylation domain-containing protein [Sphingomonadales bacterium]|nr:prepilin-type N-terminal cleavage/methylation domain-containing protein [Sphingomonadales bacterium]